MAAANDVRPAWSTWHFALWPPFFGYIEYIRTRQRVLDFSRDDGHREYSLQVVEQVGAHQLRNIISVSLSMSQSGVANFLISPTQQNLSSSKLSSYRNRKTGTPWPIGVACIFSTSTLSSIDAYYIGIGLLLCTGTVTDVFASSSGNSLRMISLRFSGTSSFIWKDGHMEFWLNC